MNPNTVVAHWGPLDLVLVALQVVGAPDLGEVCLQIAFLLAQAHRVIAENLRAGEVAVARHRVVLHARGQKAAVVAGHFLVGAEALLQAVGVAPHEVTAAALL